MKNENREERRRTIEEELAEASLSIREEEWKEENTGGKEALPEMASREAEELPEVSALEAEVKPEVSALGEEVKPEAAALGAEVKPEVSALEAEELPETAASEAEEEPEALAGIQKEMPEAPAGAGTSSRKASAAAAGSSDEQGKRARVPRSRRGKPSRGRHRLLIGAGILAGAAVIGYGGMAFRYRNTYFPNTIINGIEAGGLTAEEVKTKLASALDGYAISITGRNGTEDSIAGADILLHTVFDGQLEVLLQGQNPLLWGLALFQDRDASIDTVVAYDETAFDQALGGLSLLAEDAVVPYREAYLSDYISGQGYQIIPEEPGTEINREALSEALSQAVLSLQQEISLEAAGCYVHPSGQEPPQELVDVRDEMNRYAGTVVTYTFGSTQEVLDGETIHTWVSLDEGGKPLLDETMVSEYVSGLAKKYNTSYTTRSFMTSYGKEVKVAGVYGWRINQSAETSALAEIIRAGESQTREPEYSQKAASHDGNDYGNTYAEVNLTAQHLFFYKDGEKILESDFVSGNVSKGYTTPPGLFSLTYKQKDAVLRGEGYASPVKFWMPFNGGIGFHDASWRNQFGGTIYKTNGSHGCVNMPYSAAKTLYENVYAGMPVVCYNLEGTESGKSSQASGSNKETTAAVQTPAAAAPSETQPQPETPAATVPSETQPQPGMPGTAAPSEPQLQPGAPEATAPSETQPQPETPAATAPTSPQAPADIRPTAPAQPSAPGGGGQPAGPSGGESQSAGPSGGASQPAGPSGGAGQPVGPSGGTNYGPGMDSSSPDTSYGPGSGNGAGPGA